MKNGPAIELINISKRFGNTMANNQVNLVIKEGEIHALVGENGAGKTTLMNILYGLIQPDKGEIEIHGDIIKNISPAKAIRQGIGMVHQHFMLIPPFTVTENIVLGNEPVTVPPLLNYRSARKNVRQLCERYGFSLDADARIESLSVGLEQKVEILKILFRDASILILDEPTAVLTPHETDELFLVLRRFKREGKTIVFISHKLNEVLTISDRISVMRSGKIVGELITANTTKEEIARLMVGRDVLMQVDKKPANPGEPVIVINNLDALNNKKISALKNLSLTVFSGEIFGIAGVEGNGQTELIEVITGVRSALKGDIKILGQSILRKKVKDILRSGLAHIPADRIKMGIIKEFDIRENLILGRHDDSGLYKWGFQNHNKINRLTNSLVREYDIRPPQIDLLALQLSGGNQQKLIVARELSKRPRCIIAAQPTRGVDIGAVEFIHEKLIEARDRGVAILLISSDLSEIMSLSDRIGVIYEGQILDIVKPDEVDERELGLRMTGLKYTN